MNHDHLEENVRRVVAQHLGVHDSAIQATDRLERDLALLPLDVVLVALRIEELEKVELPIERLDSIHTVGQLTAFVRHVQASARRRGSIFVSPRRRHRRVAA